MELENKLGLSGRELDEAEERISKRRAKELYAGGLKEIETGTWAGLAEIHRRLFEEIYPFAGKMRTMNISKGMFRFASALYLDEALKKISAMPQGTFDEIIRKYVEMNIAHPFMEGNGRATRIWLDDMLMGGLGKMVDWQKIPREDYLMAMERSPVKDTEIRSLIENALTEETGNQELYMHSIDASYRYEGYSRYRTETL